MKNLNPISSYINFSQHKPEYSEIYYLIAAQFPYAAVDYYLLSLDLSNGLLKQDELTLLFIQQIIIGKDQTKYMI